MFKPKQVFSHNFKVTRKIVYRSLKSYHSITMIWGRHHHTIHIFLFCFQCNENKLIKLFELLALQHNLSAPCPYMQYIQYRWHTTCYYLRRGITHNQHKLRHTTDRCRPKHPLQHKLSFLTQNDCAASAWGVSVCCVVSPIVFACRV